MNRINVFVGRGDDKVMLFFMVGFFLYVLLKLVSINKWGWGRRRKVDLWTVLNSVFLYWVGFGFILFYGTICLDFFLRGRLK